VQPRQQPINEYEVLAALLPFSWAAGDLYRYCSHTHPPGPRFNHVPTQTTATSLDYLASTMTRQVRAWRQESARTWLRVARGGGGLLRRRIGLGEVGVLEL
jgi:hypothetical protein